MCRTMQGMEKNDEQVTVPTLAKQMAELAAAKDRGCIRCTLFEKAYRR